MRFFLILTVISGLLCGGHFLKQCGNHSSFKEPASGTCKGYWDCNKGIVTFRKCSYLYTFDNQKSECVWNPLQSSDVSCGKDIGFNAHSQWCKKGRFFKSPVNGLCDNYYDCQNGHLHMETCLWPSQFNPQERECLPNTWPLSFSCWNGEDESPVTTTKPEIISSTTATSRSNDSELHDAKPQCTKGRTFVAVNAEDCSKYYSCDDGVLTSKDCGYFEKFDAASLECRWFNVDCSSSNKIPNEPVTTLQPMTSPTPDTASKLVCLDGNYYTAVYPSNCQKYNLCLNGKITVEECPSLQRFDPMTHQCKYDLDMFYFNVNCSVEPEEPVCRNGYYFKTAVPGADNKYYDCSNGILTVIDCGSVKKFIASRQSCVFSIFGYNLNEETKVVDEWISQAQQLLETELQQQSETSDDSRNSELELDPGRISKSSNQITLNYRCGRNSSLKFPLEGDCHKYHKCLNGSFNTLECPYGNKFDNATQQCTAMTHCDLLTCYSKGPLCYPGITYNIPFAGDCKKYSECKDGNWETKSCSWLHKFNPSTLKCEFNAFSKVNCDAKIKCFRKTFVELSMEKNELLRIEKQDFFNLKSSGWPKCGTGENFKTAFPYDCAKFLSCSSGNMTLKSCPIFEKFDPKILNCRFNSPWDPVVCGTNPGKPKCGTDQKFKFVFPYDCAKYYDCSNGNLTVKSCSLFDKFDPKILECRFKFNPLNPIDCDSPPGEPTCTKGKHFRSVYPDDCSKYYKCSDGVLSEEKCALWMLFDPAILNCRLNIPLVHSVNCSAVPGSELVGNVKVRDTTKSLTKLNISANLEDSRPKFELPHCSSDQKFQNVYPNDCQKYIDCNNGSETIEKCSWLKKFNPATLKCRWDLPFYRVNCSAVPGSGLPVYPIKLKENCKVGKHFKAVDKSDCGSYYSCSDGNLSYISCGLLKKFDPITLSCAVDLPFHRVKCSAMPGQPICPESGIIRKSYPGNCDKYYECNNGTLSVETCGLWQKFDHNTLTCRLDILGLPVNCNDDSNKTI